jgi:hypothetical protein
MQTKQAYSGTGRVYLDDQHVFALWVCEPLSRRRNELPYACRRWRVRVSLDEYEALGLPLFSRVRLQLPGRVGQDVLFKAVREFPPWVWLVFETW